MNRSIQAVTAEISARGNAANYAATTKRNRRFISAKAATLSQAADIARAAARQLTAARSRILDEVAKAEAASFIVQEDFSVIDRTAPSSRGMDARNHATAIQAAVTDFVALDVQVSTRLQAAANTLKDLSDNWH
jgi:hypothetical protein